ncbi:MAG: right-handed parallel beta-helix repeat-containing protein [Chthoniobacterales bacterium]|nr:right-handed parallel beta-helix repeat-containing protein [Chthoniobacterales bacterium]
MTTKRIRCSCGRIYDPVKRPACPDCGAAHAVATPPEVPPQPEPLLVKPPVIDPVPPPPSPINPRLIAIAAAVVVMLLVFVIALRQCGSPAPKPAPEPTPRPTASIALSPSPIPSAAPSVSPSAAVTATPVFVPPPFALPETFDLNAALAQAAPGATIKIPPGSYPGGLVVNKAVHLVGAMGQVFFQSEGRECLSVHAPGVTVQNVQFLCNGIGELPAISIAQGADLELEACKVQSSTAVGVSAMGGLKALGSSFTAASGTAVRLNQGSRASLTQCSLGESQFGLWLANGATAELHSCAFDRNGAEGRGATISLTGAKSSLTAEDCHFTNNSAGIRALDGAMVAISKSSFKNNGVTPTAGTQLGLVVLFNNARGTIAESTFESNQQGVSCVNGSQLEIEKCQFAGGGIEANEIPFCQAVAAYGKGAVVTVRHSVITDSAQYAVNAIDGGKAILEETEISGTRSVGLAVGDREAGRGQAEVKRCQFLHNRTAIGLVAGSAATIEGAEIRENQDGIILADPGTRLRASKLKISGQSDAGLFVRLNGEASISDSDFTNNARGAIAGVRGKTSERATLTLKDCRFGGSRYFGVGACVQSVVSLTNCTFNGSDKQNIYKERGATVQTNEPVTPTPPNENQTSPTPAQSVTPFASASPSPSPESSAPSPGHEKKIDKKPRRTPTPRPHLPTPEDVDRLLRQLLPGS